MSVRSLALFLFVQLALTSMAVWAADGEPTTTPAIEMSETAQRKSAVDPETTPVEVPGADVSADDGDAVQTSEAGAVVTAAAVEAPGKLEAPGERVAGNLSGGAAPSREPVSWWRETASFLGLAPDPHPGETAEPAPGRPPVAPDYIIGPGDVLGISVWRDENLTRSVVVLPDGKISFPLVGDLIAGGKTVAQLRQELEGKLTRFVTEAGLTVEVKQSSSMIIYIIGRVNVPGRQMMVASTNVLQALAMAGGLNPFANKSEIKVFRQLGGKTSAYSFNYKEVSEGRHLETNIDLQRGDVIIVP